MATGKNTKGKANNGGSQANVQHDGLMALESRLLFSAVAWVSEFPGSEPSNDGTASIEAVRLPSESHSVINPDSMRPADNPEGSNPTPHPMPVPELFPADCPIVHTTIKERESGAPLPKPNMETPLFENLTLNVIPRRPIILYAEEMDVGGGAVDHNSIRSNNGIVDDGGGGAIDHNSTRSNNGIVGEGGGGAVEGGDRRVLSPGSDPILRKRPGRGNSDGKLDDAEKKSSGSSAGRCTSPGVCSGELGHIYGCGYIGPNNGGSPRGQAPAVDRNSTRSNHGIVDNGGGVTTGTEGDFKTDNPEGSNPTPHPMPVPELLDSVSKRRLEHGPGLHDSVLDSVGIINPDSMRPADAQRFSGSFTDGGSGHTYLAQRYSGIVTTTATIIIDSVNFGDITTWYGISTSANEDNLTGDISTSRSIVACSLGESSYIDFPSFGITYQLNPKSGHVDIAGPDYHQSITKHSLGHSFQVDTTMLNFKRAESDVFISPRVSSLYSDWCGAGLDC